MKWKARPAWQQGPGLGGPLPRLALYPDAERRIPRHGMLKDRSAFGRLTVAVLGMMRGETGRRR